MSKRDPFFVLSLPRSRSTWVSEFLSFAGRRCGHDLLVECESVEGFVHAMGEFDGSAETAAVLGWRLLRERWPHAKLVTIHRPLEQIIQSFSKHGLKVDEEELALREQMLLACSKSEGVFAMEFDQLDSPAFGEALFSHCLDMALDYEWWEEMRNKNVQIDLVARVARLAQNAPRLQGLRLDLVTALAKSNGGASWARLN